MSTSTITQAEAGQLEQTIEMFEVITQSQPQDYQSLEILKEAYTKLGREKDIVNTSKRIAQAYVLMGQLSSAILEYETILQRCPNDPDVQAALKEIESKATTFQTEMVGDNTTIIRRPGDTVRFAKNPTKLPEIEVEDGRRAMHKLLVDSKVLAQGDFDLCWPKPDLMKPPASVVEPFLQAIADKGLAPLDRCMKLIADKARTAYIPIQLYDVDMDLARTFPADTCRRWCVLPFDRISKSICVATTNPFNQQAAKELAAATPNRLLWYLVPPKELIKLITKAFR